jgi:hypothetical protein
MPTKPEALSDDELEQKIQEFELSRINLRVSPVTFGRLQQVAEFQGITIEEHCVNLLQESLKNLVGKATISAPTFGQPIGTKVVGPSGQSLVTRA